MARKTLSDIPLPITLGTQIARDEQGTPLVVELYVDRVDGIVKTRVVDPPNPVDPSLPAIAGDRIAL